MKILYKAILDTGAWHIPWDSCLIAKVVLPPLVLVVLGACRLRLFLSPRSRASDKLMLAFGVYAISQDNVLFTLVLITCLHYFESIGSGPTESGLLVGMHMTGTSAAMLSVFLLLKRYPELVGHPLSYMRIGCMLQVLGGLFFCSLGIAGARLLQTKLLVPLLFAARFLQGIGGGCQVALAWSYAAKSLSGPERSVQNMRMKLSGCLGLGIGPFVTSLAIWAAKALPCSNDALNLSYSSSMMFSLAAILPWAQVDFLVRAGPVASMQNVDDLPPQKSVDMPAVSRVCIISFSIGILMLRNLSLASLEAGLPNVLQTDFSWGRASTGLPTSMVILAALPVQIIFEMRKTSMSLEAWTVLMLCFAVAGSLTMLIHDAYFLIASSMVVFSMMTLSSGLVMGLMQDAVFPAGHLLDLNTCTLVGIVSADLMGRGLGPALGAWAVSHSGQSGLAYISIFASFLVLVMYGVVAIESCSHRAMSSSTGN